MVGFGSSLRMARRPGWEGAYLDYETLKLLLTQIEAVYEEEAHLQQQREGGDGDGGGENKPRDYRDDLFIESDSDVAFESLMKCDYYSATEDNSDLEQQQQQQQQQYLEVEQQNKRNDSMINSIFSESDENRRRQGGKSTTGGSTTGSALPFSLSSYSHDPTAPFSSEYGNYAEGVYANEDDDDEDDIDANCVPISSAWGKSKLKQKKQKSKDVHNRNPRHRQQNSFLSPGTNPNHNTTDAFILDASTTGYTEDENTLQSQESSGLTSFSQTYHDFENPSSSSILNKPFRRTSSANEQTSLLPVQTNPSDYSSSLYSFASHTGGHVTSPQSDHFSNSNYHHHNQTRSSQDNNPNLQMPVLTSFTNPRIPKAQQEKLVAQRKQERRQRRQKKRDRANIRKALEQKVPPHIRLAHSKARDITERFLGLLRAECEKVMLFTQSRLGELSDTVGSLRFPSMEDNNNHNNYHQQTVVDSVPLSPSSNAALSYEGYPLSDGGMHASASSSSDDGAAGGSGTFYWSDSSSNDSVKSQNSPGSPHRGLSAMKDLHKRKEPSVDYLKEGGEHRRDNSFSNRKRRHDGFDSAKRHLDHFEKLRRSRPIFQRNGNIVGEDLLLLSAVDEADGYTAVGVELMHVLRFICVNLVALRKICRKHDRLLMNRMLGGYYHHLKMTAATAPNKKGKSGNKTQPLPNPSSQESSFKDEHVQNAQTLGGLLARESGDIFEVHHPAVIGQGLNNYKLAGLYDSNLQQLANSRTVQVISSCLVLALSEYEVSRSRANALVTLNTPGAGIAPRRDSGGRFGGNGQPQQDQMSVLTGFDNPIGQPGMEVLDEKDEYDSDADLGAPSTASSISLTRLRFTVTSIIAMREAARQKHNMYATYLSRSMLAFTGRAVLGEGLDGCSRETLDFLVSYNPDAALLMDPATLNVGLKQGMWSKRAISSVMASSLAIATTPVDHSYEASTTKLDKQGKAVMDALNLLPKATFLEVPELFKGQLAKKVKVTKLENEAFRSVLRLNRMSHLLYNMNYYVVHPTTITFVQAVASPAAHSALIIGAPSLSAILAALLHCYVLSGDSKAPLKSFKSLRWLFIIAALFGSIGNGLHIYGIWQNSVPLAVLGRFVLGLSSTEILHRHIVASCLPMPVSRILSETATLVQTQVVGMLLGLLVGTLAEYLPYHITGWGIKSLSSSSWLMGLLWFMQLVSLCFQFTVNRLVSNETMAARNAAEVEQLLTSSKATVSRLGEPLSQNSALRLTYGAADEKIPSDVAMDASKDSNSGKKRKHRGRGRKRRMRTLKSFPSRLHRLVNYNIAVPVCILTILFIKFAQEVLFSSCPMILDRYFRWGGGHAGIFLACLALTIPMINFVCGQIARKYEERTVIKRAVVILAIGLFAMINFESIISLAFQITELLHETAEIRHDRTYDWLLGLVQYFVGFSVAFLGLTAIDSASLSLLSKVSPPRIRSSSVALQLGTIVSFVGMVARVLADLQILMIGLSHRLINTDLVNSLVIPLFIVCFIVGHFVRKHFFFLM